MFTLVQPAGNLTGMNFQDMYHQCSAEDHDISPLDFVFEHLLNFESIINYFEGESEEEHQPYQSIQSYSQVVIAIPKPLQVHLLPRVHFEAKTDYPVSKTDFYAMVYNADIFHPPII